MLSVKRKKKYSHSYFLTSSKEMVNQEHAKLIMKPAYHDIKVTWGHYQKIKLHANIHGYMDKKSFFPLKLLRYDCYTTLFKVYNILVWYICVLQNDFNIIALADTFILSGNYFFFFFMDRAIMLSFLATRMFIIQ